MAGIGFCGPTYQSQSPNVSAERCVNWYPESTEGHDSKTQIAMYSTPGLKLFCQLMGPSVRGECIINARVFAVSGTQLYELFSNGSTIVRGTALVNDFKMVSMAASTTQLLIAAGGSVYLFQLDTNTFSTIPPATFQLPFTGANGPVSQVGFDDGFFVALLANSNKFYVSGPLDATDWVTNGSTIVSVFPDNIVSMIIDHREIALGGLKASVIYFDSGNLFPFDVVPGGFIEQGSIATFAPAKLDNSIFWLGGDERGAAVAWRMQGYTPVRVSNHAIENKWQAYAKFTDAISYSYQDQGHSFWVLYFPTGNATWVYDVSTDMWHERNSLDPTTGQFNAHHSQCHVFAFGKHLVGDWATGKVYDMNIAYLDDDGAAIQRMRRAPNVSTEEEWIYHHQLQVDLETGITPQPLFPDAPISAASDNFNRANQNPIGAPWAVQGGSVAGQIFGNQYIGQNGGSANVIYDGGIVWPADQISQATLRALTLNSGLAVLTVRGSAANSDGYALVLSAENGGGAGLPTGAWISKILGGVETFLTTQFGFSIVPNIGDSFSIQIVGSVITCLQNGAQILTATDSSITSGNPGIGSDPFFGVAGDIAWDDFSSTSIQTFRGPQANLRWSDDGGHTWSNLYSVDCGQAGQYTVRAIWRRLGRSRDRVYELTCSDPISWRIVSAYLKASPGFSETERLPSLARKSA